MNREISLGEILRKHVGFSLPALDQDEARRWWKDFKGQGTGEQQVTFDELGWNQGCLYFEDQFYRSSKRSRMRDSSSPDAVFDPVEQDQIRKRLDAIATRMSRADCGCERD